MRSKIIYFCLLILLLSPFILEAKKQIISITLKDIDILAKKLKKNEIDVSELGYDKVLSTGKITQPLTIKAKKIVEKAKKKIEGAGGKVIEGA